MMKLNVRDHDMAVFEQGHRPPLLFIHGYPLDHAMWAAQLEAFAPSRRVIAPDLAGAGQSDPGGHMSLDGHADDLAALLDALLVPRAVVIGLSMGGYIALALWRRHPERLAGLVLACTRAGADSEAARAGRYQTALAVEAQGPTVVAETLLAKLLTPGASAELAEQVRAMMLRQPSQGVVAALKAMAARPDSTADLAAIRVPTLVVAGVEDSLIPPSESEAMAATIPAARLAMIPGAGHLAPWEEPGAFNAALRSFLELVDAA